tara:strand:- start:726 stop:1022 length:297 start_codon:yes stop_codon:yes gene_type:complete
MLSIHDPNLKERLENCSNGKIYEKMESMYNKSRRYKYMCVFLASLWTSKIATYDISKLDTQTSIVIAFTCAFIFFVIDKTHKEICIKVIEEKEKDDEY